MDTKDTKCLDAQRSYYKAYAKLISPKVASELSMLMAMAGIAAAEENMEEGYPCKEIIFKASIASTLLIGDLIQKIDNLTQELAATKGRLAKMEELRNDNA